MRVIESRRHTHYKCSCVDARVTARKRRLGSVSVRGSVGVCVCVCVCVSGFTGSNMCDDMCDKVLQGSACVCVCRCAVCEVADRCARCERRRWKKLLLPYIMLRRTPLVLIVTPSSFISPALSYYFLVSFTAAIYYSYIGLNMFGGFWE